MYVIYRILLYSDKDLHLLIDYLFVYLIMIIKFNNNNNLLNIKKMKK